MMILIYIVVLFDVFKFTGQESLLLGAWSCGAINQSALSEHH